MEKITAESVSESNQSNEPQLLRCQIALRELCLRILELRPENSTLCFQPVRTSINPGTLEESLQHSSVSDLLLKDGESLSMPSGGDYYPDLNLYIGNAALIGAGLCAWGWNYPKVRREKSAPDGYREYPGELDWAHQLDIDIGYKGGGQCAAQSISVSTSVLSAGELPTLSRSVSAPEYAETGYEGHNFASRKASSEEEVMELLGIAQEMFDKRIR